MPRNNSDTQILDWLETQMQCVEMVNGAALLDYRDGQGGEAFVNGDTLRDAASKAMEFSRAFASGTAIVVNAIEREQSK